MAKTPGRGHRRQTLTAANRGGLLFTLTMIAGSVFATQIAHAKTPNKVDALLDELDDLWRDDSSHTKIAMKVKTKHYTRSMRMEAWSKGKERSLIRILSPRKEKGTTTLKSGKNLYTYLPKTDRTIKLTSAMMSGSWMGSHLTNDDLVKESRLRDDYTAAITSEGVKAMEGVPTGTELLEITLTPRPDAPVVWGKVVLTISAKARLPLRYAYYDEDMKVARTMTFHDVKKLGGRELPVRMRIVPSDKPGEYSEITYEQIEFQVDLADSFFSVSRLRRR